MEINAKMVKELRERTNLAMMDCKKALKETDGDIEAAIKYLKEKGMIKMAGRSGRDTKEGLVCISVDGSDGIIVEINCETDFVSKNEDFQKACQEITDKLLKTDADSVDKISEDILTPLKELSLKMGETLNFGKLTRVKASDNGHLTSYIHMGGKIGVLLYSETKNKATHAAEDFINLTKDVAMHIAAMAPAGLNKDDVDPAVIKEQEEIFKTQAKESGKPENMLEKIAGGMLNKFLKDIVLLEQAFVKEAKQTVKQFVEAESKKVNDTVEIKKFIRYKIGE